MGNLDVDVVNQTAAVAAVDGAQVDVVNQTAVVAGIDGAQVDVVNQTVVVSGVEGAQVDRLYAMAIIVAGPRRPIRKQPQGGTLRRSRNIQGQRFRGRAGMKS